jgi:exopolyphosphatase / guanosine-5'-triphosphate,3'-diphosphate pyrophosphatase
MPAFPRKDMPVNAFQQLADLSDLPELPREPGRMAIIDMGSNTWRLIVVEYVPRLSFKVIDEIQEQVRMGEGMAELPVLRPAAMDRGARAAQIYAAFCQASGIGQIQAAATSAIRDAQNQKRFLARIEKETGIRARVLSGEEEAYYGYLAAVNSTTLANGFVLDMGGGSLQITRVENRRPVASASFPLGSVRMTEGFLKSDPAGPKEIAALTDHVRAELKSLDWFHREPGMVLVGEGGNVRLLARLAQRRHGYPLDILHGYTLTYGHVFSLRDELARLNIAMRRRVPGMKAERADISLAGAVVVQEVMRRGDFSELTVCAQGMREGIFYEAFFGAGEADAPPMFADVRRASVLNLCHLYRFQESHAEHIAHLVLSMAAQIPPHVREFGDAETDLLWAAGMLHDIGVSIDYHDHHRHGAYLILNAGLPGYSHRELALIALMVRFHRKGAPDAGDLAPLLAPNDDARLLQMAALLRLAEQIDRARDGGVRDVALTFTDTSARLQLMVTGDEQVPLWAVERHRDFFAEAFGVPLEVVPVPIDPS